MSLAQSVEVVGGLTASVAKATAEPPPPPFPSITPEKITVSATVQCAFQIL